MLTQLRRNVCTRDIGKTPREQLERNLSDDAVPIEARGLLVPSDHKPRIFKLIELLAGNGIFTCLFVAGLLAGCKSKPPVEAAIDAWYKHLVIYNLDVKTYQNSNGDGEGDFRGLTSRLPYLQDLGINMIWLVPF